MQFSSLTLNLVIQPKHKEYLFKGYGKRTLAQNGSKPKNVYNPLYGKARTTVSVLSNLSRKLVQIINIVIYLKFVTMARAHSLR